MRVTPGEDCADGGDGGDQVDVTRVADMRQSEEETARDRRAADTPAASQPAEDETAKEHLFHEGREEQGEENQDDQRSRVLEDFLYFGLWTDAYGTHRQGIQADYDRGSDDDQHRVPEDGPEAPAVGPLETERRERKVVFANGEVQRGAEQSEFKEEPGAKGDRERGWVILGVNISGNSLSDD